MNVVFLSTYDIVGGANLAAYRIHRAILEKGLISKYCVSIKRSDDFTVLGPDGNLKKGWAFLRPYINGLPKYLSNNYSKTQFSLSILPTDTVKRVKALMPDIVHLHWITDGFLRIEELARFNRPLVWTLHDMWPITGGCHYDNECGRNHNLCGKCPLFNSKLFDYLSTKMIKRKQKAWRKLDLTIVTPSKWLFRCAQSSSVFRNKPIKMIPYCVDLALFRPRDKQTAREMLNLPTKGTLLLLGSKGITKDRRKGFQFATQALQDLSSKGIYKKMEIAIFGASMPQPPPDFGFKVHYLGYFYDQLSMAVAYNAADLFIAPSIQDNFPNTILEALACGTPCLAFKVGGMPDMIMHKKNGYIAHPLGPNSLEKGITWFLNSSGHHRSMSIEARKGVERYYRPSVIADQYFRLYKEILQH